MLHENHLHWCRRRRWRQEKLYFPFWVYMLMLHHQLSQAADRDVRSSRRYDVLYFQNENFFLVPCCILPVRPAIAWTICSMAYCGLWIRPGSCAKAWSIHLVAGPMLHQPRSLPARYRWTIWIFFPAAAAGAFYPRSFLAIIVSGKNQLAGRQIDPCGRKSCCKPIKKRWAFGWSK